MKFLRIPRKLLLGSPSLCVRLGGVARSGNCRLRDQEPFKGGVDAMLIWTIAAVIPVALMGSAFLASKGGPTAQKVG